MYSLKSLLKMKLTFSMWPFASSQSALCALNTCYLWMKILIVGVIALSSTGIQELHSQKKLLP